MKLVSPTPHKLLLPDFYQIIRTAKVLSLFANPLRDQTNQKSKANPNLTKVKQVFAPSLYNDWSSTEGKEEAALIQR